MPDKMESKTNCGVCGNPLEYSKDSRTVQCSLCGKKTTANIYCEQGHYICDECHAKDALTVTREVLKKTKSSDPIVILEEILAHPSVPMHGPEHHAIIPAIILTAVANAGYAVPENAVETAIERGSKVPGGWCGYYGTCGAGVGVGIAVSILTEATPLKGKSRSLSIGATAYAMSRMIDEQPRCCARASRVAIEAAMTYLQYRLNIDLTVTKPGKCQFQSRNKECARDKCRYG